MTDRSALARTVNRARPGGLSSLWATRPRRRLRRPLASAPTLRSRFCFIGGLHRSGTSILHRVLRENPDVTGVAGSGFPEDEGQHLQSVFPRASVFGGPGRFAFHTEAALDERSALVTPQNRDRLLREWGAYLDFGVPAALEKSPPNLIRMRFFQAMFPGARFVLILRHPIATALATAKWTDQSIFELMLHWYVAHRRALRDFERIETGLAFRYEDFAREPQGFADDVAAMLGIPEHRHEEAVDDRNARYFERWRRDETDAADLLEGMDFDSLLRPLGYSMKPPYVLPLAETAVAGRHLRASRAAYEALSTRRAFSGRAT